MRLMSHKARSFALVAGISLTSMIVANGAGALAAFHDDEPEKVEKAEKPEAPEMPEKVEKKRIRVIRSGAPDTVIEKDGKVLRFSSGHHMAFREAREQQEKAVTEARAALETVEARLNKAKKKDEKEALEAARDALQSALDALEARQGERFAYAFGPSKTQMRHFEISAMENALENLHEHAGDLSRMRIELKNDLDEARAEIAEAMEDLDVEIDVDSDDEMHALRLRSLNEASESLERMQERRLEELKNAEEHLKRERERLEKRLEERKTARDKEEATPEN